LTAIPMVYGTRFECEQKLREYVNPDTGIKEFDRGNLSGFCTPSEDLCEYEEDDLSWYYKCSNGDCLTAEEKHFSRESCTKSLQYSMINHYGMTPGEKDICYENNTCEFVCGSQTGWYINNDGCNHQIGEYNCTYGEAPSGKQVVRRVIINVIFGITKQQNV